MTKVLVLYYSAYGHIETMAEAVALGARDAGATVDIRRRPELVPDEVAKASHYKLDQAAAAKVSADTGEFSNKATLDFVASQIKVFSTFARRS